MPNLTPEEEADVEDQWKTLWEPIIFPNGGRLDLKALKYELADYGRFLDNTSAVFDQLTGGRISKPHTLASAVVGVVEELEEGRGYQRAAFELTELLDSFEFDQPTAVILRDRAAELTSQAQLRGVYS